MPYIPSSSKAEEFICHSEILDTIRYAEENKNNLLLIDSILDEAEKCGCHIITVPNDILAKSKNYGKDLEAYSLETVQGFYKDASGLGFTIL